jgi:hypothetical protein
MQSTIRFCSALLVIGAFAAWAGCSGDDTTPATPGASAGAAGSTSRGGAAGSAGSGLGGAGRGVDASGGAGGGIDASGGAGGDVDANGGAAGAAGGGMDSSVEGGGDAPSHDGGVADVSDASTVDGHDSQGIDSGSDSGALRICAQKCNVDDDCTIANSAQKFFCNQANDHCVSCLHDVTCVAQSSLWLAKTCLTDGDCATDLFSFGDFCVDVEGSGYCAFSSTNTNECFGLADVFTAKKFGGDGDTVQVCANTSSKCDTVRGSCVGPCGGLGSVCTPAEGGTACNTTTMHCECASDTDCGPGAPRCNLAARQCECASTTDCANDSGRVLVCE